MKQFHTSDMPRVLRFPKGRIVKTLTPYADPYGNWYMIQLSMSDEYAHLKDPVFNVIDCKTRNIVAQFSDAFDGNDDRSFAADIVHTGKEIISPIIPNN